MSATATLLVLLASGESDPTSAAIVRAARQTLDASVIVKVVPSMPSDTDAQSFEHAASATAVAEVAWRDGDARAAIHVYSEVQHKWSDREIVFAPGDAPAERGRTIGYALASMLPEVDARPAEAAPPSPPPPPQVIVVREVVPAPADVRPKHWAVDIFALGAFGGDAQSYGGAVSGQWLATSHLGVRLGLGAREGSIPAAGATHTMMFASLGVAWRSRDPQRDAPFAYGFRVDALLLRDALEHLDADDASPVERSRFLPGADAYAEGSWRLGEGAALVLGLGVETAFGATDVYLRDQIVATLPVARGAGELGIRASF